MPGHVKRGGTGDPDPDPSPFLVVSASDRQKDLAKVTNHDNCINLGRHLLRENES